MKIVMTVTLDAISLDGIDEDVLMKLMRKRKRRTKRKGDCPRCGCQIRWKRPGAKRSTCVVCNSRKAF